MSCILSSVPVLLQRWTSNFRINVWQAIQKCLVSLFSRFLPARHHPSRLQACLLILIHLMTSWISQILRILSRRVLHFKMHLKMLISVVLSLVMIVFALVSGHYRSYVPSCCSLSSCTRFCRHRGCHTWICTYDEAQDHVASGTECQRM